MATSMNERAQLLTRRLFCHLTSPWLLRGKTVNPLIDTGQNHRQPLEQRQGEDVDAHQEQRHQGDVDAHQEQRQQTDLDPHQEQRQGDLDAHAMQGDPGRTQYLVPLAVKYPKGDRLEHLAEPVLLL